MPKTWLSLAGAEIPDTFQGTVFFGKGIEPEPATHLSFRERADERCDFVRMIRDKQYAYYKNYMPYAPAGQYLEYLWKAQAAPDDYADLLVRVAGYSDYFVDLDEYHQQEIIERTTQKGF